MEGESIFSNALDEYITNDGVEKKSDNDRSIFFTKKVLLNL